MTRSSDHLDDLLASSELAEALEHEAFKHFLDHLPVAIVIAKIIGDQQRIVYANLAFETLTGIAANQAHGKDWSILDDYSQESDPAVGQGEGTITLHCLRQDDGYAIEIADNGIGLPAGETWPKPGRISALIVRSLTENTNAIVEVESEPGRGTKIRFVVPVS